MYRVLAFAFCVTIACGLAASESLTGVVSRGDDYKHGDYDYTKCYAKYQICCNKKYECGHDTEKYLVHKKCYKKECYDEKVPKTAKKCETKYGHKKVCKDDHKKTYRPSVRSYDYGYEKKEDCYDEKYSYPECHDYTYYENHKKCYDKEYDCSYYAEKKVAKYCDHYECGDYKETKVGEYKYFEEYSKDYKKDDHKKDDHKDKKAY